MVLNKLALLNLLISGFSIGCCVLTELNESKYACISVHTLAIVGISFGSVQCIDYDGSSGRLLELEVNSSLSMIK